MGSLRFIATFIEVIIKGCMESPAIRTVLIILLGIAAFIFIPHWIGLLVTSILPGIFPPPAWAGGLICIVLAGFITLIFTIIYMGVYSHVKDRMRDNRMRKGR